METDRKKATSETQHGGKTVVNRAPQLEVMVTNHFQSVAVLDFQVSPKRPSTVLISDTCHPLDTDGQKTRVSAPKVCSQRQRDNHCRGNIDTGSLVLCACVCLNHCCDKFSQA